MPAPTAGAEAGPQDLAKNCEELIQRALPHAGGARTAGVNFVHRTQEKGPPEVRRPFVVMPCGVSVHH